MSESSYFNLKIVSTDAPSLVIGAKPKPGPKLWLYQCEHCLVVTHVGQEPIALDRVIYDKFIEHAKSLGKKFAEDHRKCIKIDRKIPTASGAVF